MYLLYRTPPTQPHFTLGLFVVVLYVALSSNRWLFYQNNHLVLRARQVTGHVTPRRFSHPRLTSRSPFLTLLTLASPTLHAQSQPPHLRSPPPSSSKSLVTLCMGPILAL